MLVAEPHRFSLDHRRKRAAPNSQTVICKTNKAGTDHGQTVYKLQCGACGRTHGANGSDIFQRRCPHCDPKSTGEDLLA